MGQIWHGLLKRQPIFCYLSVVFAIGLTISWGVHLAVWGQVPVASAPPELFTAMPAEVVLPAAQVHPLPATLTQWQNSFNDLPALDSAQHPDDYFPDDYFDVVEPTPLGYLIWSRFPVQVYIEPADLSDATGRSQIWHGAVSRALQEWAVYLPLEQISTPGIADITIWRVAPPLQPLAPATSDRPSPDRPSPIDRLPRARSAESRYEIGVRRVSAGTAIVTHRFTIHLSPHQAEPYTEATARHEIGHALGIWGHSPQPTDALYFSQVRHSPPISHRDVNTLKRIYAQPTRLGWPLPEGSTPPDSLANPR